MHPEEHPHASGDAPRAASSRPPRPHGPAGAGLDRPAPTVEAGNRPAAGTVTPSWLTDPRDDEPRGSRRHLLLAVAVIPWIVVLVWFLRIGSTTETLAPGTAPSSDSAPPEGAPLASPAGPSPAGPTDESPATDERATARQPSAETPDFSPRIAAGGGARTAVTLADATSLAVMVARDWLGGAGPRLGLFETPLIGEAYVDHVAVEAVDHPGTGHVVVTVIALLLEHEDGDFTEASLHRIAIPIAVDADGARPAGTPWLLPPPELELAVPVAHEIDDPTLVPEVTGALEHAGYRDVEVVGIGGTDGWPLVATVDATAPGRGDRERHVLWLRANGNALVLAGHLPREETS